MGNNDCADNTDRESTLLPNEKSAESSDENRIDYDESKHEDKSQISTVIINYEFFISHASNSQKIEKDVRPSLSGEKEFVKSLVDKLEKYCSGSTYVDYRDNPNFEFSIFHPALKSSKYGVFVCSPRFKDRYLGGLSPFITEEVKHFWTIKNTHHQPERLLPIMFGLDIVEYEYGPFSSSDFVIDAEYGKLSLEQMIEKVMVEIERRVGS